MFRKGHSEGESWASFKFFLSFFFCRYNLCFRTCNKCYIYVPTTVTLVHLWILPPPRFKKKKTQRVYTKSGWRSPNSTHASDDPPLSSSSSTLYLLSSFARSSGRFLSLFLQDKYATLMKEPTNTRMALFKVGLALEEVWQEEGYEGEKREGGGTLTKWGS